jgi:hypothetical protein
VLAATQPGRTRFSGSARCLAVTLVALSALLASVAGAGAATVIDDTPTILGPVASVHHETGEGWNGTLDWVNAQGLTNPEVNAARWDVSLSPSPYLVEAYIPRQHGLTYARYAITHAGATTEVRLNQHDFGDVWVSLGTYQFDGGTSSVRSTDSAGQTVGEDLVWDAIRFTPVSGIPPSVETSGTTTYVDEPQVSGPGDDVVRFVGIGFRDDLLRTYAQGDGATTVNSATWTAPIDAGTYDVAAYIAREHGAAAVSYDVRAAGGVVTVPINQSSFQDTWVPLGRFTFGPGGAVVTSDDATSHIGDEIDWDALRFTQVPPGSTNSGAGAGDTGGGPMPTTGTGSTVTTLPGPPTNPGTVKTPGRTPAATAQEPLVADQRRSLLVFAPLAITIPGSRTRTGDAYRLASTRRSSTSITLRYRCGPCKFLSVHPTLRNGRVIPQVDPSGSMTFARLHRRILYKGTILHVTAARKKHRSRLYTFRLTGHGRVRCTVGRSLTGKACRA